MTEVKNASPFAKALAVAGVFALSAGVLAGCAPAEEAAETGATTTPGGCELGPEQDGDLVLKLGSALPLSW